MTMLMPESDPIIVLAVRVALPRAAAERAVRLCGGRVEEDPGLPAGYAVFGAEGEAARRLVAVASPITGRPARWDDLGTYEVRGS